MFGRDGQRPVNKEFFNNLFFGQTLLQDSQYLGDVHLSCQRFRWGREGNSFKKTLHTEEKPYKFLRGRGI